MMSNKSCHFFLGLCAALLVSPAAIAMQSGPPAAQDSATSPDPLQWLEEPKNERALEWARKETEVSQAKIKALPEYRAVDAELRKALAATDPAPGFLLFGRFMLKFERSVRNPYGILSVAERDAKGAPGGWRQIVDMGQLREREGKRFQMRAYANFIRCLGPVFERCMIGLAAEGGDELEWREFDLVRGAFVENGFRIPTSRSSVAWMDADTLLVQHTIDAPSLKTGWPAEVKLLKRGQPLAEARTVFRAGADDAIMTIASGSDGTGYAGVIWRAVDYSNVEHIVVRVDGSVERTNIPRSIKLGAVDPAGGYIVAQLAEPAMVDGIMAPAETVVAYDYRSGVPAEKRLSAVYTPAKGEFLTDVTGGLAVTGKAVRMVLDRRGVQRIVVATHPAAAWEISEQPPEPVGINVSLSNVDPSSDGVIVQRSGFLLPGRVDLLDGKAPPATLFAQKPAFDASRFRVDLKTARSKDGTEIDYYLLRPRKAQRRGEAPLLMTGYGAFGVAFKPDYLSATVGGKALIPWLERGGSLALPLIRGGGERGAAWHQAAIRERRQNSYDDFAAVTEKLIGDGFTSPKRIGVFGMSNGGLLSAVMGTQRPDLYGAIVSDVPLTDLVRMSYMGMGAAWTNEYGDARDPKMREAILRYSPYQNVVPGRKYPPFLITIATSDNRVGPGHARKLAARLGEAGSPVYFLEDQEGGHGVSDPLSRPELMAARMTFLIDTLMGTKPVAPGE